MENSGGANCLIMKLNEFYKAKYTNFKDNAINHS